MADFLSKEKRSKLMASIRSTGNKDTELALMALLRANCIRGWRRDFAIKGKPDFVFYKERIALFVDGCFWHGCPKHGHHPQSNEAYWLHKLKRNRARDRAVKAELQRQGWCVIRVWEHSLKKPGFLLRRIKQALELRRLPHKS